MHRLDFDDLTEEIFRTDMRAGADAGAAVGETFRSAILHEFLQIFGRIAGMNGEHVRTERDDRDRAQIID